MKTIIYFLLAIFIFGIIASGFSHKTNTKNSILIQTTDNNISPGSLSQSANIISNRLRDFCSEKFQVAVIPEKNQIQVILGNSCDLKVVESLLIQKGSMAFYETYNRKKLTELLQVDNHLFLLLNSRNLNDSDPKIGCTTISEIEKVNDCVKSLELSQPCKFAWNQYFENSNACLYALKTDNENGALITGADIESANYSQEKVSGNNDIEITLKKAAKEKWADATKRNINNAIAIVLDNRVVSAPIVKSVIEGGNCIISGNFTKDQVKWMVALINNGELPLNFRIVK